jgi:DNA-directed RNA polymerase specialized sigma subunit
MLNSSEHITAKDLENLYGRAMKPTELAKFLGIDVRTVKKYGDRWGGVEVAPGYMRFFENRVLEGSKCRV